MAIPIRKPSWFGDFAAFIARGNVIDLAVGVVIGAAFTAIVNSLVEDLLNPVIGLLVGGIDFSNLFVVISGERGPSLAATRASGAAVLAVGQFINAIIKFIIVAFAVFWLVRLVSRLHASPKKDEAPPREQVLLQEIRDELRAARGVGRDEPPRVPGPA
ncbi:large conductance mechanosensitive channel protein MscL [Roseomonas sp. WA12]